jgi:UDP-3-O-[3-hydroxymyristoyl] N-acetylglucosamine deacetylase
LKQRTLKKNISIEGIGLHSGLPVQLIVSAALPGQGIRFVRSDLSKNFIEAKISNVKGTQLATTLSCDGISISTIEHLMSALAGYGIDNATIEINGPEVPILDGSAIAFANAIKTAGVETQLAPKSFLAINKRVELQMNGKLAVVEPSSNFEIHTTIEWEHPSIGYQEFHYKEGITPFEDIASARTFGFAHEADALRKMGLAKGGSLDNAVILDQARVLNPDGLRFTDEFVRHKTLDALGDFKLAGLPILGKFRLHRAGHELHTRLIQEILSNTKNYEIVNASSLKTESVLSNFFRAKAF